MARLNAGPPAGRPRTVLIFTATVGGGHVAAARAVRDVVEAAGHRAVIVDGLEVMSRRLKWFQADFYAWQLEHTPWSYEQAFRILALRPVAAAIRLLIGHFWGDRLQATVTAADPDVVVSTYPVVTAGLGRLLAAGHLDLPVIAIVTDFGVHPMWASPPIDLHLVPCQRSLELVERAGGTGRVMDFPVGDRFRTSMSREEAREALGLPREVVIPLIAGGAWGVGNLEAATASAVAAGAYPVVVTARNTELREALECRFGRRGVARILGWTDQMPELMAAADCLIQHAGGVTCLEAIAVGLPILFTDPIPGHGRFNARIMAEAGAARFVGSADELRATLAALAAGETRLEPPRRDPGCPVASAVLDPPRRQRAVPIPARRPRIARAWSLAIAAVIALVAWIGFSPWVMGLAIAHTPLPVVTAESRPGTAAVVVRTDSPEAAAALERAIDRMGLPVALFVDARAAPGLSPNPRLTFGVAEDRYVGRLHDPVRRWRRIHDSATALARVIGSAPAYVLPDDETINLVDVAIAPRHAQVVLSTVTLDAGTEPGLVVVDTTGDSAAAAVAAVEQRVAQLHAAGVTMIPLAALA